MGEVHVAFNNPPDKTPIAGTGRSGLKISSARDYQATAFMSMRQLIDAGAQIASVGFNVGGIIFTINTTNHPEIYEFKTQTGQTYYLSMNFDKLKNLVTALDKRLTAHHIHGYGDPHPINIQQYTDIGFTMGGGKKLKAKYSLKKKKKKGKKSKKKKKKKKNLLFLY